jgi:hypothetical protein
MGNRYLRKLLVVGAHAVLYHRKPHEDALRSWAKKLMQTKLFKLVAIVLVNKMARSRLPSCAARQSIELRNERPLRQRPKTANNSTATRGDAKNAV